MPVDVSTYPKFNGQSGVDLGAIAQRGLGIEHSLLANEHERFQIAQQQRQYAQQKAIAPLIQSSVRPDGTMDYQKLVLGMAGHPITAELVPQFIEQAGKNKLLDAQIVNQQLAAQQTRSKAMAQFFASALLGNVQRDPQTGAVRVQLTPEQLMSHLTSPSATEAGITPSQMANIAKNYASKYAADPASAGMDIMRAGLHALTDSQTVDIALGKQSTAKVPGAIMSLSTPPLSQGGPTTVTGNIPVPERDPQIEAKIQQGVEAGRNPDGTYGPKRQTEDEYRQFVQGLAAGTLKEGKDEVYGTPELQDLSALPIRGQGGAQQAPAPMAPPGLSDGGASLSPPMPSGAPPPPQGFYPGQAPQGATQGGIPAGVANPSGLQTPAALGPPGNLYSDAALGTGVIPAAQSFLRGTAPQAVEGFNMLTGAVPGAASVLGPVGRVAGTLAGNSQFAQGQSGADAVRRQTALNIAMTPLVHAFAVDSQTGRVNEGARKDVIKSYGIAPDILSSPAKMQDRMEEIDRTGRLDLQELNNVIQSPGTTPKMKQEAIKKAQALGSFLNKLNVPRSVANPNARNITPEQFDSLSDEQQKAVIRAHRRGGQ